MKSTRNSKKIFEALVLIVVLAFGYGSAYAVTLPFEDGFENIAVGDYPDENGWRVLFSGKNAYVSDTMAHTGMRSFRLDSWPNWAHMDYVQLDEIPDRLTYEVSMYVDPSQGKAALAGFMKGVGNMGPVWNKLSVSGPSGMVVFTGPEGHIELGSYTPGTWCTVRADLDFLTLKGDLWVNGELVAEGVDISPKEFDDPTWGHVVMNQWGVVSTNYSPSAGSSNVVYFDDVKLYETPVQPQIVYAQFVLHEIGDWTNVADLLGPPDDQYAYTANSDTTVWAKKSTGAAVWLDFGRIIHSGTIVIYHDDPAGHYTNLGVGVWHFRYPDHPWYGQPRQVPLASDRRAHGHPANIQGTGIVTCYTATRDFRYVRLDHFTTDPDFQDGIDAVAVIEGDAPGPGLYLDPPPDIVDPPIRPVSQWNNGYWNNPGAILGEPDGVYAWSRNPQHTCPRLTVDIGRVVYSGQIVFHHNKPYPVASSLGLYINSQEYDPDPDTCPDVPAPVGEGWERLFNALGPSGLCTVQFPPTHFRYIYFEQSQCFPGQEDGIDAIEVYESPALAGFISGTVTDRSTGTPIEGATVLILDKGGLFLTDTVTAADGSYVFSGVDVLPRDPCSLKVVAEDYGYATGLVDLSQLPGGLVADFELARANILYVPYYNQGETSWCGPTSLSMGLKSGNVDFKPWEIAAEYSLGVTPSILELPFPVADFCARKGIGCESKSWGYPLLDEPIANMLGYVKDQIRSGRAVVLTMPSPTKHAVVIVGYDEDDNLYINDPSGALFEKQLDLKDWSKLVLAGPVSWYELQPILERNVNLFLGVRNATFVLDLDAESSSGVSCYTRNNTLGLGGKADQSSDQLLFRNSGGLNELALRLDGESELGYRYYNVFGNHPELLHSSLRYAAIPDDSLTFSPYISNALPYGLDDPNLHFWIGKILPNGDELTGKGTDFGSETVALHPFCSLADDKKVLLGPAGLFEEAYPLSSLERGFDYCIHLEVYRSAGDPEPADELSFKFHLLDEVVVRPEGGTVAVPDGDSNPSNNTRIEIPAGAVGEDTVISITKVDAAPNADYAVIDPRLASPITAYEIAGRDEEGKEVPVIFEGMATIYLWYPDIDNDGYVDGISPPLHESSLHVWTWHEGQHRWQLVTNAWMDTENNLIGFHTYHLSTFAVFANMPPIADAGPDQVVECACNTEQGTKVTLDGTDSNDPEGDPLTYTWTGPFAESPASGPTPTVTLIDGCVGEYVITLVVNDGLIDSEPDTVVITVVDTTPPVITCPPDVTLECPADTSVSATGSATATDACGSVTITHSDVSVPGCGNTETITRTWTATDECDNSASCVQTITVVDTTPPEVEVAVPPVDAALQDGVTLTAEASDISGVAEVYFYLREPGGTNGIPIGYEDLPGTLNTESGKWEYAFDTTQLEDGYYVILAKGIDTCGNEGWSAVVPFSIRNWAVLELLPASVSNKAGRTMPVKFALRIVESVDPAMPFVYNEGLEIRIYDAADQTNILQTSLYGDTSRDYRIDSAGELYITNFKTKRQPAKYIVEIWRTSKNFLVGSFTFETVK